MQHRIFDYESSEQLLHDRQIAGLQLPFARETGILKTPLRLGQRQIENRLAAQPVEGFDALPDGSPSEKNMARYRAYAAGMSGMIWLESVSVCASGRSNPSQLWLRRETWTGFAALPTRFVRRPILGDGPIRSSSSLIREGTAASTVPLDRKARFTILSSQRNMSGF